MNAITPTIKINATMPPTMPPINAMLSSDGWVSGTATSVVDSTTAVRIVAVCSNPDIDMVVVVVVGIVVDVGGHMWAEQLDMHMPGARLYSPARNAVRSRSRVCDHLNSLTRQLVSLPLLGFCNSLIGIDVSTILDVWQTYVSPYDNCRTQRRNRASQLIVMQISEGRPTVRHEIVAINQLQWRTSEPAPSID